MFLDGLKLRVILFKRILNEGHGIMGCHEVLILTHADKFAQKVVNLLVIAGFLSTEAI